MSNPTLPTPTSTAGAPTSTLNAIETKVRRLTRSPSTAQLSQADLDNYINTAVVYDFPEILRTFNLRTEFSFFTNPGQDVYNTDQASFAGAVDNPLYNFQNLYLTVHPPFYAAGYQCLTSQSPEQLFGIYPKVNSIAAIASQGDGTAGPFSGTINSQSYRLLQNHVLFSAIDTSGLGMAMVDVPVVDPASGFKFSIGNLYNPNDPAYKLALSTPPTAVLAGNFINYETGAYTVTFPQNTLVGSEITSQTVATVLSLPQSVMYFSNTFTIRPVPDQAYRINFQVFQRPTALLSSGQSPELEEYWQFIAFLASKKIFEDRMDMDSVALIMPALKEQESLCLRRTIVQNTNERTATIYTQNNNGQGSGYGWGNGGNF